jgi:hypothetical protein
MLNEAHDYQEAGDIVTWCEGDDGVQLSGKYS